jgi:DNA polymerase III epsilon subunit-like protein
MFVSDMLVRADALVFHDTQADMAILRDRLCVKLPDPDIPCYNTQVLYGAQEGSHKGEVWGLERMLQRLGLPSLYLHNAGNDAYATMEAFLRTVQPSVSSEQSQHLPQSRQTDTPSIAIAISFDEDDF